MVPMTSTRRNMIREDCQKNDLSAHAAAASLSPGCSFNKMVLHPTGRWKSCFEWESTPRSIIAFVMFIVLCYYFEPYMIPIALLLIFLKYYIVLSLTGGWTVHDDEEEPLGDDDDDEEDKDKEEKKSLKERLQAIQEVTQSVQNSIGFIASLGESIKNTFNFTVPYLSTLAILMLIAGTIVLYLVSVRYLIMAWGINKFARKLIRPHTVPNNEVLDLLSRVPDDEDLCQREFQESFPGVDPPDRSTVRSVVNKSKTTGPVLDKKRSRRHHILAEEEMDDFGARLKQLLLNFLTNLA
ncbi:hypothetical protein ANN_09830 [Periplaneta americana]|uniref:Multiple C2 domain-containing protein n=1 Tax=Periplaneta americana TaxID=6978 RepID=A0ABQ8TMR4_PERAM|nr:hypothetical protein ANN_09830 [Periplaneta americana]